MLPSQGSLQDLSAAGESGAGHCGFGGGERRRQCHGSPFVPCCSLRRFVQRLSGRLQPAIDFGLDHRVERITHRLAVGRYSAGQA